MEVIVLKTANEFLITSLRYTTIYSACSDAMQYLLEMGNLNCVHEDWSIKDIL